LAQRGWQVTVLDAAPAPANGASGLPVGLYAPYISADNNLASQITAIGVDVTQQLAKRLLVEGVDWQPSGLMTRKYGESERWHSNAGWIKPSALVHACLSQPGLAWRGTCEVKRLVRETEGMGDLWSVIDKLGQVIAQAEMVVIAASKQSAELLNTLSNAPKLKLQAIRGQVSFGNLQKSIQTKTLQYPVNGNGSYIETSDIWLVGATYDRDNLDLTPRIADQVANFDRLESLAPETAAQLKPAFERGLVNNWVGIRCASTDRLPIVGKIEPGLWVLSALGSRGLTLAPLCAELLASQLHDEVLPLNPRQVRALSVMR
jgi:tRNA 5-methylaminomethyl-2-thiouridine biosynthesis bifunctional protein